MSSPNCRKPVLLFQEDCQNKDCGFPGQSLLFTRSEINSHIVPSSAPVAVGAPSDIGERIACWGESTLGTQCFHIFSEFTLFQMQLQEFLMTRTPPASQAEQCRSVPLSIYTSYRHQKIWGNIDPVQHFSDH
ncbi:Tastin [Manis pentadactyla]|nr:Tastin [Manis pentadactyla]